MAHDPIDPGCDQTAVGWHEPEGPAERQISKGSQEHADALDNQPERVAPAVVRATRSKQRRTERPEIGDGPDRQVPAHRSGRAPNQEKDSRPDTEDSEPGSDHPMRLDRAVDVRVGEQEPEHRTDPTRPEVPEPGTDHTIERPRGGGAEFAGGVDGDLAHRGL